MATSERGSFSPFVAAAPDRCPPARLITRHEPRLTEPVPAPTRAPLAFHRSLDAYRGETPLVSLPDVAEEIGLSGLYVKDESSRLGLPSFKVLGAAWAVYRALGERLGEAPAPGATPAEVRAHFARLAPLTLVAATDGNHGRALAHVARTFGFDCRILVPAGMAAARIAAIEGEGATVEVVEGSYDLAVETAAAMAAERTLVIADTASEGYEQIPEWISEGYSTIFWEIDDALERRGEPQPDLVVVQIGVGALARAVIAHYRRPDLAGGPAILGVEPIGADCALETLAAGRSTYVPGPHTSVMVGLNAGWVSLVALPALVGGLDAAIAIPDDWSRAAVRKLSDHGIVAGETGAAGLGALLGCPDPIREATGRPARALVIVTESATDPVSYRESLESAEA